MISPCSIDEEPAVINRHHGSGSNNCAAPIGISYLGDNLERNPFHPRDLRLNMSDYDRERERATDGKNRQFVQTAWLHFPIERDLWRAQRGVGLRPAWGRAQK